MARRNRPSGALVAFVAVGSAAIVGAGLFSALTARSASYHSAWLVAYLVLIVGISQIALGAGHWLLASKPLGARGAVGLLLLYNLGNVGVMAGTLTSIAVWVDVGSALLAVALLTFGWAARSSRRTSAWWAYWAFLALLLVSVVVGLFFAHTGPR